MQIIKWLMMVVLAALTALAPASFVQAQEVAVPASREQMTLSFAPVVKQAAPAVVNIYTRRKVQVRENVSPFMNDPFFRQFFGDQPGFSGRTRERVVSSLGSGVIIRPEGLVVTSNHVINQSQEITVVLADKREFEAKILLQDAKTDLAFLQIKADVSLPALALRDSDTLDVGELVLAIGNPFGVGQTVTQGIISALARTAVGVSDYQFFIQTDAAINPGNSGGALVDMQGRLIGINTAIYSKSGGSNGIGFAIPANMVKVLAQTAVEGGKVVRPWMGITSQPVTSEVAESVGLKTPRGVLVARVAKDGPAARAGIREGDIVLSMDGVEVADPKSLEYRIALGKVGSNAQMVVLRQSKEMALAVPLEAAPKSAEPQKMTLKGKHPLAGLVVVDITPALLEELGVEGEVQGVVVIGGSAPAVGGFAFRKGDVILQVNGEPVLDAETLESLLRKSNRQWQIILQRGNDTLTINLSR